MKLLLTIPDQTLEPVVLLRVVSHEHVTSVLSAGLLGGSPRQRIRSAIVEDLQACSEGSLHPVVDPTWWLVWGGYSCSDACAGTSTIYWFCWVCRFGDVTCLPCCTLRDLNWQKNKETELKTDGCSFDSSAQFDYYKALILPTQCKINLGMSDSTYYQYFQEPRGNWIGIGPLQPRLEQWKPSWLSL